LRLERGLRNHLMSAPGIVADKFYGAVHHHLWCVRAFKAQLPGVLLLPFAVVG
jgi:hypothetical protein